MGKWCIASSEDNATDGLAFLTSCGITVPSAVVETLAQSPEYREEPLLDGTVRIRQKIANGTLLHVGHAVRLMLELAEAGIVLPEGVSLGDILHCLLYHDLGKRQPEFAPGEVVVPGKVFEDGKLHAARSAELLREHGGDEWVQEMVRYHHHGAGELPESLSAEVRAALRVVQLVDGLSEAVLLRDASIYVVRDDTCSSRLGVEEVHPATGRIVYHELR